ncbi:phosphotransferase enzyme family protein [Lyngbya confervoides]|uniref:Aminoglycoside phosphotransferase family protein n=1 Tax=Lyngbya confervoides BDU141951 TaxID=1574623 RepID=A0ABD4T923_9CYAN|nr:aminoglycoside phosphotransferase family protein [Lyngbya confervoides]MCM1985019.1 aminoglycoside phosphotransferase family protein [Lyngbya confervoides BDU141951]
MTGSITDPSCSLAVAQKIAAKFFPEAHIHTVQSLGEGNINDTYQVRVSGATPQQFVLQRINPHVFAKPQQVVENICRVGDHIAQQGQVFPAANPRRWEVPRVIPTPQGERSLQDSQGYTWRAMTYIDAACTYNQIHSPQLAQEVGFGLGVFHRLIHDLPVSHLIDTLEGFHITPRYLDQFDAVCAAHPTQISNLPPEDFPSGAQDSLAAQRTHYLVYGLGMIRDRRAWSSVLETAKHQGRLRLQPIHGDPKVNNVMIDAQTHQAVGLIDLDTVKPGLIHYDIGDCLRSGCNPLGEETTEFHRVSFDLDLCAAMLRGYCTVGQAFLQPTDYDYLYDSIRLLPFELGLRFFTDYLAGNSYFKVTHPEQNLHRAVVQFKLVESIEAQAPAIRTLIQSLR